MKRNLSHRRTGMVQTIEYKGEISGTVYKARSFVPKRVDDLITNLFRENRKKPESDQSNESILTRFLMEMVIEPKLTDEYLKGDGVPADEISGLTLKILEDTGYKGMIDILSSDETDPEKIKKLATNRLLDLKKKVNRQ